ncbi:MAG: single-strand DNA-binding protein [Neolewinella sp.]|jgi:single-strand DNA-binding protein
MNTSNFINLIGRLGEAPKTVTLASGTTATEFSLATNDYYRDRDGNRQTRTEWHRVKAYGKIAEIFDQYLDRGKEVSIVGSMRYRKWVDKHDQTRTSAEVIAESFSFIGSQNRDATDSRDNSASLVAEPLPDAAEVIAAKSQNRRAATAATEEPVLESADQPLPF